MHGGRETRFSCGGNRSKKKIGTTKQKEEGDNVFLLRDGRAELAQSETKRFLDYPRGLWKNPATPGISASLLQNHKYP